MDRMWESGPGDAVEGLLNTQVPNHFVSQDMMIAGWGLCQYVVSVVEHDCARSPL